jgi:hypothetical protein
MVMSFELWVMGNERRIKVISYPERVSIKNSPLQSADNFKPYTTKL